MRKKRPSATLARSTAAAAAAGTDAAMTISMRLPILLGAPTAATAAEWTLAWTEKMQAFVSGSIGAGAAAHQLAIRMGTGQIRAEHLPTELLAVVDAAARPGYRAVRANARRLSKRQPR